MTIITNLKIFHAFKPISNFLQTFFFFLAILSLNSQILLAQTKSKTELLQNAYVQALKLFEEQKYEDSLNAIRKVINFDVDHYNLRYLAAHNYLHQKKYISAILHFEACIKLQPMNYKAYANLTSLYIINKQLKQAQAILNKFYKIYTDTPPIKIQNVQARVFLHQNELDKAINTLAKTKTHMTKSQTKIKQNDQIEALILEAKAYILKNGFTQAEISLLWALEINPTTSIIYQTLAYMYYQWSQYLDKNTHLSNEAIDKADKSKQLYTFIQTNPKSTPEAKKQATTILKLL